MVIEQGRTPLFHVLEAHCFSDSHQQMKKNSNKVAILCDSTKFGKTFLCKDFDFDDVDYVISDKLPPQEYLDKIASSRCKLITPETLEY